MRDYYSLDCGCRVTYPYTLPDGRGGFILVNYHRCRVMRKHEMYGERGALDNTLLINPLHFTGWWHITEKYYPSDNGWSVDAYLHKDCRGSPSIFHILINLISLRLLREESEMKIARAAFT